MKTSKKTLAKSIVLSMLLTSFTGVASAADEFINYDGGVVVGYPEYTDKMTVNYDEDATVNKYGIFALGRSDSGETELNFTGKKLTINTTDSNTLVQAWWQTIYGGIYCGTGTGDVTMNIKTEDLEIVNKNPGNPHKLGEGPYSDILGYEYGIGANHGYDGQPNSEINIDLQNKGDLTIKDYATGIGIYRNAKVNVVNAVNINIEGSGGGSLPESDANGHIYAGIGSNIRSGYGGVYIQALNDINTTSVGTWAADDATSTMELVAGNNANIAGRINVDGTGNLKITAGKDITAESLYSRGHSKTTLTADGDILLSSTSTKDATISLSELNTAGSEAAGEVSLISKNGKIIINADNYYGITMGNGGVLNIIGDSQIVAGSGCGLYISNGGGTANFIGDTYIHGQGGAVGGTAATISFNGNTKLVAESGEAFGVRGTASFTGNTEIEAKNGVGINLRQGTITFDGNTKIIASEQGINTGVMSRSATPVSITLAGDTEILAGKVAIKGSGAVINITGSVDIRGNNYSGLTGNDVAVSLYSVNAKDRRPGNTFAGTINMNLNGLGTDNQITGSIVADQGGDINITNAKNMTINGNILAGNTYTMTDSTIDTSAVNIALEGTGSSLSGRIDDFRNFTAGDGSGRDTEWNGISAKAVTAAGNVTLSLTDGATWKADGDSHVTTLNLDGGIVDLSKEGRQTVDAQTLTGTTGTVKVNLDNDNTANNDYIKAGSSEGAATYTIDIVNPEELYGVKGGKYLLATTDSSSVNFKTATVYEKGLYNYNYIMEQGTPTPTLLRDAAAGNDWYVTSDMDRNISDA